MDGGHAEKHLRHAEKNRKFSTCKFADRVFCCVTSKLDNITHKGYWPSEAVPSRGMKNKSILIGSQTFRQAVVAAFVLYNSSTDQMECISIGVGTKFLDYKCGNQKGNSENS